MAFIRVVYGRMIYMFLPNEWHDQGVSDKLTNRESELSGTVRAKTLDPRWFNIPECKISIRLNFG